MADPQPSRIWMGREGESLGPLEGDTLVIERSVSTTRAGSTSAGFFHSEEHACDRAASSEGDTLTWQATVEDPDVLLRPWPCALVTLKLNPIQGSAGGNLPCIERDLSHLVDQGTSLA